MFIYCDDHECEERATFSMEIPTDLAGYEGICHIDAFFCQDHMINSLKMNEWRKVRKLNIWTEEE